MSSEDAARCADELHAALARFWASGVRNATLVSEWYDLYVRRSPRPVGHGCETALFLDLTGVQFTATHQGHGIYSRLLDKLRATAPCHLYIESILDPRLEKFLDRVGFQRIGNTFPSFYHIRDDAYDQAFH